jgi:uncharacterized protein
MKTFKIDEKRISKFCRKNHIRRLALFGSVLTRGFRAESDLDILVEFEPGHIPGLAFFKMEKELSEILGRKVDLNTRDFLSPDFRDQIASEAETVYAKAG